MNNYIVVMRRSNSLSGGEGHVRKVVQGNSMSDVRSEVEKSLSRLRDHIVEAGQKDYGLTFNQAQTLANAEVLEIVSIVEEVAH